MTNARPNLSAAINFFGTQKRNARLKDSNFGGKPNRKLDIEFLVQVYGNTALRKTSSQTSTKTYYIGFAILASSVDEEPSETIHISYSGSLRMFKRRIVAAQARSRQIQLKELVENIKKQIADILAKRLPRDQNLYPRQKNGGESFEFFPFFYNLTINNSRMESALHTSGVTIMTAGK
ncbi:unnamed protein product [Hermetia illucens]|uniref:Uncharacterized protein n=1 Tax=Hermetia illucens TaxID=343691 RepID=A0A7R8UED1_HERIL|nr:unnamed protein product [Hermetia illucens]